MLITCEKCAAHYEIPDEALEGKGRKVKCNNCGHVWFQKSAKGMILDELKKTAEEMAEEDAVAAASANVAHEEEKFETNDAVDGNSTGKVSGKKLFEGFKFSLPKISIEKFKSVLVCIAKCRINELNPRCFAGMTFIILMLVTMSFIVLGRNYIVRQFPEMLALYKAIDVDISYPGEGIVINTLVARQVSTDDRYDLEISGEITNILNMQRQFPEFKVSLLDQDNKLLRIWFPEAGLHHLKSKETKPFTLRFDDIPSEGLIVEITVVD